MLPIGFVPPIPLAPPLPFKPGAKNPIDTIPLNPADPFYPWPNIPWPQWPWAPEPEPDPDPVTPAPIPLNPNADPLGYPDVPPESMPFPANPNDPDTEVRWEVDFSVTSINISRPNCQPDASPSFGETTVYSDTLHTYSRAITVVTRQGLLDSLGCNQPETGFGDAPSDYSVKVRGDNGEVVSELSSLSRNTLSNFYQPGRLVTYVTTIDAVRRADDTQPLPDFLPNPDQPKTPVPLPIIPKPLVPFPDPEFPPPAPEPEPEPAPAPPIQSPDTPTAPPFAPPKAPPGPPQVVPTKTPKPLPVPLPTEPGTVPLPEPVPEVPPSPEPAPDPNTTPAPSPQPLPGPGPVPIPGPTPNPVPEPGTDPEPEPTPIPTPGQPEPATTPDLVPIALPTGRWPLPYWWPFNRPKNNIRPFTNPKHHFPVSGGPPVTPGGARPSDQAIANELGRVEQKNSQQLINFGNMLQILELLQEALEDFFAPTVPEDQWTLRGICETVPEGEAQPYHKWDFPESSKVDAIGLRVDALAEMLQVHLAYKTPTCTPSTPELEGEFRTISFRSDETSPYGKSRLRKRLRYRSSSGLGLGEIVDHWKDFTFTGGPIRVRHTGSSWGTVEVWASTEAEGKRVIQHAAGEAGIDPNQVGRWSTRRSNSSRLGVSLPMRVDTTGGYYWITARDGSDNRPIVARNSDQ